MFYLKILLAANLLVAYAIIMMPRGIRPGIIAVPIDIKSNLGIISLAHLITMTPGTLSVDISSDRRVLYVHAMYMDNPEKLRNEIKDKLEKRVKELFK